MVNQTEPDEKIRELIKEKINNKLTVLMELVDADITWHDSFWRAKVKALIKANLEQ